ncbi:MAG: DUF4998 domain-containing protein [Prevotellaceae bacterium]|jgi:hypothetical protein|nr:DUF4998 domain-containing protein [Prevotellaceae bacterium]
MKHILYSIALGAVALAGCGSMDETYREFRGDGPIVYLAKYPQGSIEVLSGKSRLKMVLPPVTDIRVKKASLAWWADGANRTQTFSVDLNGMEVTVDTFVNEGSYVFSLTLYDETGKYSSLPVTLNGVTYGETYASLLNNRTLAGKPHRDGTSTMTIVFLPADAPPLVATRVGWKIQNTRWTDTVIYPHFDGSLILPDTLKIPKFNSDSIYYSAIFKPVETFIDTFMVVRKYEKETDYVKPGDSNTWSDKK